MRTSRLLPLLFLGAGLLSTQISPSDYAGGRSRDFQQRAVANQSALAVILGEFRTSMSDMMFLKTERMAHGGVALSMHDSKVARGPGESSDASSQHGESLETVIPDRDNDFRRWIGDLHRQVKPWHPPDEHRHIANGTELVPWFRLITLSDPHYVRGYILGAAWLEETDPDAALEFVEEGLKHNPDAFRLHLSKAFLLLGFAGPVANLTSGNLDTGQKDWIQQAINSFERSASLAVTIRPPGWTLETDASNGTWGTSQETDAFTAVRMAVLLHDRYGDPRQALLLARQYLSTMPRHTSLLRYVAGKN